MLYRKFYYDNDNCQLQLIVPRTHQQVVFKHFHDIPSAGQLGPDKMISGFNRSFTGQQ